MRLAAGHRVGPYEILAPLGAGGMGEVYRAQDTRLGRDVAIKVLPAERLADEGRRRRFVQEARAASALNHPNIVTIYEIETIGGSDFIVMEYVPGQTLDGLISRQGMRLAEALRVAIAIADALAAAHSRGIVHRDLKPANVIVTPDGVVKVLDFGLAKLVADETEDASDSQSTMSAEEALTRAGAIAGTAAYMSPEQATGEKVDARSDIFSFGALLYEMLTGRRAFSGKSASETLAAVVRSQPQAPHELVPGIPDALERLVLRCLRKEPDRRFHHMVDVRVELQELKEESDSQAEAPTGSAAAKGRSRRRWIAVAAFSMAVAAAAAAVAVRRLQRPGLPSPTVVQLSSERQAGAGSFSPDGTQIAYALADDDGASWGIWVRIVGQQEARRLTTDQQPVGNPAWSPDGSQIAFMRHRAGVRGSLYWADFGADGVYLVSPLGGAERRLSDLPAGFQLSWSPDGRWLAASKGRSGSEPPGGIYLIPAAGGEPRAVTFPKPPAWDVSPSFSPDGRALAYASCGGLEGAPVCDVYCLPLDSELKPSAGPRRLTHQGSNNIGLAWTRDGRSIVYSVDFDLWRVHADGGTPPVHIELATGAAFPSTVAGRDRLALVRVNIDSDIYRLPSGGSPTPLVASTFDERHPQYSPDGRRIVFQSGRPNYEIWLADADGGNPTQLTRGPGRDQGTPGWSPDGRSIVFDSRPEGGNVDIWTIGVEGSGLRRITHDPAEDFQPIWSRDGRFVYFASNRTGRSEIWRAAAGGGAEEQLTHEGGSLPCESLDGSTLYYERSGAPSALIALPAGGGKESTILPCAVSFGYAAAPGGLYHLACTTPGLPLDQRPLLHWDAATGRDQPVAVLDLGGFHGAGLSVSPDGRSILYGRVRLPSDLMMIENFR